MKGNDMIGQTRWPKELYGTPPRVGLIKNLDKFDADYFNFEETEVLYRFASMTDIKEFYCINITCMLLRHEHLPAYNCFVVTYEME